MRAEVVTQPRDGIRVQVVRRLVEKERLGATEQDPGKFHAAPLAAGQAPSGCPRTRSGRPRLAAIEAASASAA